LPPPMPRCSPVCVCAGLQIQRVGGTIQFRVHNTQPGASSLHLQVAATIEELAASKEWIQVEPAGDEGVEAGEMEVEVEDR
jgi:hypothetical protein